MRFETGCRPAWADEDTQSVMALRTQERRLAAVTGWNCSTTVVRTIRDRLREEMETEMASQSPTLWIAVNGVGVSIGHHVALDLTPDTVGVIVGVHPMSGLPEVRITEGPGVGGVIHPYPGQILARVHRT